MSCCGLFGKKRKTTEPQFSPVSDEVRSTVNRVPIPPPSAPMQSASKFIVAIDFGTTFTGVAYAYFAGSTTLAGDPANGKTLAQSIRVFTRWPNASTKGAQEKTPTIMSYDPLRWGDKVQSHHKLRVSRFKLGLDPQTVQEVFGIYSGDLVKGLVPALNKSAADVTADYLTQLHKYIDTEVFTNEFGREFLTSQRKQYVITVPAIWSDRAKDLTRQAASKAGIPRDRLLLVTEPEAAALYCATAGEEVDLGDGDSFLICDAGGGTVDLIAYHIVTKSPFKIRECTVGTGAACGAFQLDEGFKDVLRLKLGRYAQGVLTDRILEEATDSFEEKIKTRFNPYDTDNYDEDDYTIRMPGAAEIPEVGLEGGFLAFSREDCEQIFQPVFAEVRRLIEAQMKDVARKTGTSLTTLLLVGGLGRNTYLLHYLRAYLPPMLRILQPSNGAIMRGAVLHGLDLDIVDRRVMRRSYGTQLADVFNPKIHPHTRKFIDELDGSERCTVAKWYAKKGDTMSANETRRFECNFKYSVERFQSAYPLNNSSTLYFCEEDNPPDYPEESVKVLCSLPVNHRKIPAAAFKLKTGKTGQKYYVVSYELELTFGSELLFKLVHEGQVIESVTANYD